ncbi:hypothetical protein ANN_24783 [Periplaneta americana]|uniref:Uncharacterized protein n=1 Tax=Periplaneta americana TaxID=6978 RepID=A0ABQ8RZK1_PERAM|nr:hypothetical protein ANN_24783 [Periplaneta americana]
MSPGSSTESYPAFARIGLRENPGKNLNQVTCPDRDSNPGHLVSQPDALTVTPQVLVCSLSHDEALYQCGTCLTIRTVRPLERQFTELNHCRVGVEYIIGRGIRIKYNYDGYEHKQIQVEIERWSTEHRIAAVELFIKTESVAVAQRGFRLRFDTCHAPFAIPRSCILKVRHDFKSVTRPFLPIIKVLPKVRYTNNRSRAVASWSKASCLGLALRNARWFESSWGKKFSHEISASVWNRYPPSIVMHLGSYDSTDLPLKFFRLESSGDELRFYLTVTYRTLKEPITCVTVIVIPYTNYAEWKIFCVIIRCKSNGTEKNSLRRRDLNPGFQLYVLMLYPLSHTGYHPGVGQNRLRLSSNSWVPSSGRPRHYVIDVYEREDERKAADYYKHRSDKHPSNQTFRSTRYDRTKLAPAIHWLLVRNSNHILSLTLVYEYENADHPPETRAKNVSENSCVRNFRLFVAKTSLAPFCRRTRHRRHVDTTTESSMFAMAAEEYNAVFVVHG